MIDYPNKLNIIFDKLLNNSIRPVIIGGFVRDFLLKKESKDIDIELYGIESFSKLEEILQEFGSVNRVGRNFGVCKLNFHDLDLDFSLPRLDSKKDKGHRGFDIEFNSKLDFKTATARRDFTINAIGYDIQTKKILDPYGGVSDLKNRILRAVDVTKFAEDPLRVLRAVQFSARFQLNLDNELLNLCKNMIENSLLEELPKERILLELEKLLLKAPSPSSGILLLKKLGAFKFFIELNKLSSENFHSTLHALDKMSSQKTMSKKTNTILMFSVLCHKLTLTESETLLNRLTTSKSTIHGVLHILQLKGNFDFDKFIDYNIYLLATQINIEEFTLFSKAITDSQKRVKNISKLIKRAKELGVFNSPARAFLRGKDILDLGLKSSKEFSIILDRAYSAQISGKFKNRQEALLWLEKELLT